MKKNLLFLLTFVLILAGCPLWNSPAPPVATTPEAGACGVCPEVKGPKVGGFTPTPTGTGLPHIVSGVQQAASSLIVNADVNAAAAIAGTKVAPDFGSQDLTTTGNLLLGPTVRATTGLVRSAYNGGGGGVALWVVKDSTATDRVIIQWGGGDQIVFGNANLAGADFNGTAVGINGTNTITYKISGTEKFFVDSTGVTSADPSLNGGRLTLTTAVPVTTADVATATSVFWTPFKSGTISLYDGTRWKAFLSAEVSIALGTLTSGKNYDIFGFISSGALALELSAAWTNDTTRADALVRQNEQWAKSGTLTRRYLGTFRTISTTQTTDTASQRYVYSADNRVPRFLKVTDATNTWPYVNPNGVYRQANASTANKFEFVTGDTTLLNAECNTMASVSAGTSLASCGVGIDSTTVNSAHTFGADVDTTAFRYSRGVYKNYPSVGYHAINWLETGSSNALTYTFVGDNNAPTIEQAGMIGELLQ